MCLNLYGVKSAQTELKLSRSVRSDLSSWTCCIWARVEALDALGACVGETCENAGGNSLKMRVCVCVCAVNSIREAFSIWCDTQRKFQSGDDKYFVSVTAVVFTDVYVPPHWRHLTLILLKVSVTELVNITAVPLFRDENLVRIL